MTVDDTTADCRPSAMSAVRRRRTPWFVGSMATRKLVTLRIEAAVLSTSTSLSSPRKAERRTRSAARPPPSIRGKLRRPQSRARSDRLDQRRRVDRVVEDEARHLRRHVVHRSVLDRETDVAGERDRVAEEEPVGAAQIEARPPRRRRRLRRIAVRRQGDRAAEEVEAAAEEILEPGAVDLRIAAAVDRRRARRPRDARRRGQGSAAVGTAPSARSPRSEPRPRRARCRRCRAERSRCRRIPAVGTPARA